MTSFPIILLDELYILSDEARAELAQSLERKMENGT